MINCLYHFAWGGVVFLAMNSVGVRPTMFVKCRHAVARDL